MSKDNNLDRLLFSPRDTLRDCVNFHQSFSVELKNFNDIKEMVYKEFPDILKIAKELLQKALFDKTGKEIDPDLISISFFDNAVSSSSDGVWGHYGPPLKSYTLTEFLLIKFSAHEMHKAPGALDTDYGIYYKNNVDLKNKRLYGKKDEVGISASEFSEIISKIDINEKVNSALESFWLKHGKNIELVLRAKFCAAAALAKIHGDLSDEDYDTVMERAAPNVPRYGMGIPTLNNLKDNALCESDSVKVKFIDVNGYSSTDILLFTGEGNKSILYIPDELNAFHSFNSEDAARKFIAQYNKESNFVIEKHFSLYSIQDGIFYTGAHDGLKNIAEGLWDVKEINKNKDEVNGDVFVGVTQATKDRSFKDADTLIKSNTELEKDLFLDYLGAFNEIIAPILILLGPLGDVMAAASFLSVIGFQIDKAITGDSEEERKNAAKSLTMNIAISLLFGALTSIPNNKLKVDIRTGKFLMPERINGKIGYPLSPTKPPRLPEKVAPDFFTVGNRMDLLKPSHLEYIKAWFNKASNDNGFVVYPLEILEETPSIKSSIVRKTFSNVKKIVGHAKTIIDNMSIEHIKIDLKNIFDGLEFSDVDAREIKYFIKNISLLMHNMHDELGRRVILGMDRKIDVGSTLAAIERNTYSNDFSLHVYNNFFGMNSGSAHITMLHEITHLLGSLDIFYMPRSFGTMKFELKSSNRGVNYEEVHMPTTTKDTLSQISLIKSIWDVEINRITRLENMDGIQELLDYGYIIKSNIEDLFSPSKNHTLNEKMKMTFIDKSVLKDAVLSNADAITHYIIHLALNALGKKFKPDIEDVTSLFLSDKNKEIVPDIQDVIKSIDRKYRFSTRT